MKIHKKPDLLFVLAVFVGLGVAVSAYIQYARNNANPSDSVALDAQQPIAAQNLQDNQMILVSSPDNAVSLLDGDAVNKSLQEP